LSEEAAAATWEGFVDDLPAAVDRLGLRCPVAIGHSLGATAILAAAAASPGRFAGLFCYEPIVFSRPLPDEPDESVTSSPVITRLVSVP
jgi:pimeloyl-ACP methyl ester carboxylesterase